MKLVLLDRSIIIISFHKVFLEALLVRSEIPAKWLIHTTKAPITPKENVQTYVLNNLTNLIKVHNILYSYSGLNCKAIKRINNKIGNQKLKFHPGVEHPTSWNHCSIIRTTHENQTVEPLHHKKWLNNLSN